MTAPEWNGKKLGEIQIISDTIAGARAKRPSGPKYADTWDIDLLVQWLDKLKPNDQLGIGELRDKVLILLRIHLISRNSDIGYMDVKSIKFLKDRAIGRFKNLKNHKPGLSLEWTVLQRDDPKYCPVLALKEYLEMTNCEELFPRPNDRIFMSIRRINDVYPEVQPGTLASITKAVMLKAGVPKRFASHSIRMATASAAVNGGMSIEDVMRQGRWRSQAVFQTFYNRSKFKDVGSFVLPSRN